VSRRLTFVDKLICEADTVMRTLSSRGNTAGRPSPASGHSDSALDESSRRHVAGSCV
jgi:ubiquinone biosynthesis monooxygenase Coq7